MITTEWAVSIRRACRALEFDRSTFHYRSRKTDQAGIAARIKAICETRVRYGYRRVHVLLRREGWDINIKKTHRIYNEFGLQLRNKTPERRVFSQSNAVQAPIAAASRAMRSIVQSAKRRCDDGMCSVIVVWRPLPLPRRWTAIRSPLWKSSIVRAVIRASTYSRAKR